MKEEATLNKVEDTVENNVTENQESTISNDPIVLKGNPNEYIYTEGVKAEVEGQLITEVKNLLTRLITSETISGNYFQFNYYKEDGTHVKNPTKIALETQKLRKELNWEGTVYDQEQSHFLTQKGIGYARLLAHVERLHYLNIQSGKAVHYSEISPVPDSN